MKGGKYWLNSFNKFLLKLAFTRKYTDGRRRNFKNLTEVSLVKQQKLLSVVQLLVRIFFFFFFG